MAYRASPEILEHIKEFEQFREKAYIPVRGDRWTIGWGNTFYVDGSPVREGDTITMEGADKLLYTIVGRFERDLNRLIRTNIKQNQFDALLSFIYNVGTGNFQTSTLLKVVNTNPDNFPEIERQFLRWNKSGGKVQNGLIRRRKSEIKIYCR